MGTAITINGGQGSDTINFAFTVTGTNTTRYANTFSTFVNNLLADGDPLIPTSPPLGASVPGGVPAVPLYMLTPSTVSGGTNAYVIDTAGYIIDSIGGAVTVGATGNDTILVAAINAATTFNEATGANSDKVIFVDGNNTFNGDTTTGGADSVGDTIVAGSGFDTIRTGAGFATVNSGTGDATIYLNDTAVGGVVSDHVWLDDGHSVVYANGSNDAVIATTAGQTIDGSMNTAATSFLTVVLQPNTDLTTNGNDLVTAGAGGTEVFNENSNNTINGGSGALFVINGSDVSTTVNGGGGATNVFGAAGDTITFGNVSGITTGLTALIAGSGDETLNGAAATSNLAFYGSADSTGSALMVGGAGNDTLQAGVGNETLTGGAGDNLFVFNAAADAGGTLTISDFGASANNILAFTGYNPADILNAINSGTEDQSGNFVVTLSDNTQITFTGVTSASQLDGHIVNF
jgi:Ca2+-binding RTX toxin-like protein